MEGWFCSKGGSGSWLTRRHILARRRRLAVTPKQGAGGHISPACPAGGLDPAQQPFQPPRLVPALPPALRDSSARVTPMPRSVPTHPSETPNRCQGSFFGAVMHICFFSQTFVHDGSLTQAKPREEVMSCVNLM